MANFLELFKKHFALRSRIKSNFLKFNVNVIEMDFNNLSIKQSVFNTTDGK